MRNFTVPVALLALAVAACSDTSGPASSGTPISPASAGAPSSTGRHIVEFAAAAPAGFAARVQALGGSVVWSSGGAGLATVSGLSATAAASLSRVPGVKSVNDDIAITLEPPMADGAAGVESVDGVDGVASQAAPAGSFFFARQWNMRAVHADQAWAAGYLGSPTVSVFLLDTGIDYNYLDLQGLVDLSRSVDLLGTFTVGGVPFTEADTVHKYFPSRLPFTDLYFHGTHVGATISSKAIAAAGVTSRTTLVAVKVCAYLDLCPLSSVLAGVIYAADHGGDVINLSLGGGFAKAHGGAHVSLINRTFNYARSKGVTIVVAAGNAAADMDHNGGEYVTYCNTPAVICVSATGPTAQAGVNGPFTAVDAAAGYTNFGRSAVDLAAPGGNNSTFVYAACSGTSLIVPVCGTGTFVIGAQGTSMASPHVAGAAALLVQQLGRDPAAIKARLLDTADDLGQSGTDPFYGKGRLNVARAVGAIQ
jgi:subtilisin family serine protease